MRILIALSAVVSLSLVVIVLGDNDDCRCPKNYKAYKSQACYHYSHFIPRSPNVVLNRHIAIEECYYQRGNLAFMIRDDKELYDWMVDNLVRSEKNDTKIVWVAFIKRDRPLTDVPNQWSWREETRPQYEPNRIQDDRSDTCAYFSVNIDNVGRVIKNEPTEVSCRNGDRMMGNVHFGLVCTVAYSPTRSYCPKEILALNEKVENLETERKTLKDNVEKSEAEIKKLKMNNGITDLRKNVPNVAIFVGILFFLFNI